MGPPGIPNAALTAALVGALPDIGYSPSDSPLDVILSLSPASAVLLALLTVCGRAGWATPLEVAAAHQAAAAVVTSNSMTANGGGGLGGGDELHVLEANLLGSARLAQLALARISAATNNNHDPLTKAARRLLCAVPLAPPPTVTLCVDTLGCRAIDRVLGAVTQTLPPLSLLLRVAIVAASAPRPVVRFHAATALQTRILAAPAAAGPAALLALCLPLAAAVAASSLDPSRLAVNHLLVLLTGLPLGPSNDDETRYALEALLSRARQTQQQQQMVALSSAPSPNPYALALAALNLNNGNNVSTPSRVSATTTIQTPLPSTPGGLPSTIISSSQVDFFPAPPIWSPTPKINIQPQNSSSVTNARGGEGEVLTTSPLRIRASTSSSSWTATATTVVIAAAAANVLCERTILAAATLAARAFLHGAGPLIRSAGRGGGADAALGASLPPALGTTWRVITGVLDVFLTAAWRGGEPEPGLLEALTELARNVLSVAAHEARAAASANGTADVTSALLFALPQSNDSSAPSCRVIAALVGLGKTSLERQPFAFEEISSSLPPIITIPVDPSPTPTPAPASAPAPAPASAPAPAAISTTTATSAAVVLTATVEIIQKSTSPLPSVSTTSSLSPKPQQQSPTTSVPIVSVSLSEQDDDDDDDILNV